MTIIKVHGRARVAHLNGERIDRQEDIFVPSERSWFKTIDTSDHFVYRQSKKRGSTLMCTCGSSGGIYNPDVYMRFTSINKGRMICCNSFMQTGKHSDGSYG